MNGRGGTRFLPRESSLVATAASGTTALSEQHTTATIFDTKQTKLRCNPRFGNDGVSRQMARSAIAGKREPSGLSLLRSGRISFSGVFPKRFFQPAHFINRRKQKGTPTQATSPAKSFCTAFSTEKARTLPCQFQFVSVLF